MILTVLQLIALAFHSVFCASIIILCTPFDKHHRAYQYFARLHARGILAMARCTLTVTGAGQLDPVQNYVFVSNHASMFDIPTVRAALRHDIRIIYKKELHWVPIFGWGLKIGACDIAIDRKNSQDAMRSIETAVEKIRSGASVILFAEGTRTRDGKLQPFKRGPFNLAMKAGVPVVPVTINGTFSIMKKGSFRLRPGTITVVIDAPIPIPDDGGKEAEFELRDTVQQAIASHYENQ